MGKDFTVCDRCGRSFAIYLDFDYDVCDKCNTLFCGKCQTAGKGIFGVHENNSRCWSNCKKCKQIKSPCIFCTKDYTKREISDNDLMKFLLEKCGYKSKSEARKAFSESLKIPQKKNTFK